MFAVIDQGALPGTARIEAIIETLKDMIPIMIVLKRSPIMSPLYRNLVPTNIEVIRYCAVRPDRGLDGYSIMFICIMLIVCIMYL